MTLTQDSLHTEAAQRIRRWRPELAERLDLATTAGLVAAHEQVTAAPESDQAVAVCVVNRLVLPSWIRGTCGYAAALGPDEAAAWRRSFTRTIFLAGNPENLRRRFAFRHVGEDGTAAWTAPAGPGSQTPLRRLLKLFDGPRQLPTRPPQVVELPGRSGRDPVHRELHVATAGVTVAGAMVGLNHLLAEAVLDGLLAPGDRLTVHHGPRLTADREFAALRVGVDESDPARLRAFAGLTTEADPVSAQEWSSTP